MKSVEVVVGVIKYGSKILCVRRGYSDLPYISFKWEFPGGKIEPNESPSDALMREIREELCLKIVVGKKIMTIHHKYPDYLIMMHAFFCFSETSLITIIEHTDYEWCIPSGLDKFDWLEADLPLIEKISNLDF